MRRTGVVLAVLLLAACTSPDVTRRGQGRPDPSFDALAAAELSYSEYLRVSDEVSAAGGAGVERLAPLVTRQQFVLERARADLLRLGGYRTTGSTSFDTPVLVRAVEGGLTVEVCLDTSRVKTTDARGFTVTPPTPRRTYELIFAVTDSPPFTLVLEGAEPSEPATC